MGEPSSAFDSDREEKDAKLVMIWRNLGSGRVNGPPELLNGNVEDGNCSDQSSSLTAGRREASRPRKVLDYSLLAKGFNVKSGENSTKVQGDNKMIQAKKDVLEVNVKKRISAKKPDKVKLNNPLESDNKKRIKFTKGHLDDFLTSIAMTKAQKGLHHISDSKKTTKRVSLPRLSTGKAVKAKRLFSKSQNNLPTNFQSSSQTELEKEIVNVADVRVENIGQAYTFSKNAIIEKLAIFDEFTLPTELLEKNRKVPRVGSFSVEEEAHRRIFSALEVAKRLYPDAFDKYFAELKPFGVGSKQKTIIKQKRLINKKLKNISGIANSPKIESPDLCSSDTKSIDTFDGVPFKRQRKPPNCFHDFEFNKGSSKKDIKSEFKEHSASPSTSKSMKGQSKFVSRLRSLRSTSRTSHSFSNISTESNKAQNGFVSVTVKNSQKTGRSGKNANNSSGDLQSDFTNGNVKVSARRSAQSLKTRKQGYGQGNATFESYSGINHLSSSNANKFDTGVKSKSSDSLQTIPKRQRAKRGFYKNLVSKYGKRSEAID